MAISEHAFIDIDYFNLMANDEDLVVISSSGQSDDESRLENLINVTTKFFEEFCNRPLKARDFSYDPLSVNYSPEYAIFDPPPKTIFWFPTYPVNSITEFIISATTIIAATDYTDDTGYFLYSKNGKLVYSYGFDYGYIQNVKVKWNGGYNSNHQEYSDLQYLTYLFVKFLWDNDPNDDGLISETLGNYKYTKASAKDLAKYFGMPPFIFHSLSNYKRIAIA